MIDIIRNTFEIILNEDVKRTLELLFNNIDIDIEDEDKKKQSDFQKFKTYGLYFL